jgi:hypothetical protein
MQLEILALRHQLAVYQRSPKRPRLGAADRILWAWLSRVWSGWRNALVFVQEGDQLTVTATGDRGESTGSGTITGNEIEWTIVRPTPMGEMSFTYQGTVTGDTMSGEVQMMNSTVPWQAVRTGSTDQAAAAEPAAGE